MSIVQHRNPRSNQLRSLPETFLLTLAALLLASVMAPGVLAQPTDLARLASWLALDAPTGHEQHATKLLQENFPGWQTDRYGNLVKSVGSGTPHRVVACALDSYGYAVSQITAQGYLRLHRIGAGSSHPLWDQAHEGQHLRILTRNGPVLGVSAVANGHFAAQHRNETALVTADDLWLDVGASSAEEVQELGISLLDPVIRQLPAWYYGDEVAGPRAGARTGCAAVFAAGQAGLNEQGRTSYVLSTQQVFGWTGLAAALRFLGAADSLVLLGPGQVEAGLEVVESINSRFDAVLKSVGIETIVRLTPQVENPDALMERISRESAQQLLESMARTINPFAPVPAWQSAPAPAVPLNDEPSRWGRRFDVNTMMETAVVLDQFAELSAVPGHEGPVRYLVYNALPEWARREAMVDDLGNLWVEIGPEQGEATVFVAHMDEVGWEINGIEADGTVNLTRLGGAVATAWEGQPALLQLDAESDVNSDPEPAQLRGVFLNRDEPQQKQPAGLQAWFGMNAAQLEQAGVRVGMGITGYKRGYRMGPYRYASRSMDDRVGTTALLLAIQNLDPSELDHRVIFAWSVREEGGLRGAGELAGKLGTETRRVYSIDTFVTSDTPLESPHFAFAPLGSGPVLRSVENSGLATPYELARNRTIAEEAGIEVQIGLTQGSTDGTQFTFFGAPNAGLSWPGRYSHSPAEIADLRDITQLIRLIEAFAKAPPGP
ncbi:MAG: M20/M25/M40 family metallo-hydrolase [Gammaproteobacteria bacterium]|nr:M20/M25/M40 family metallo-hydrolase [Pseudomonadales bacterium]MCP5349073.1 M20/M25/M40 family metallo-hydrolase [Pseudomonadales bacterium]